MKKAEIALQLYTMREPAKEDLAGTLKRCREMGWEYVQWSGMPKLPAKEIRAALDDAGLKAIAAHTGIEPFEKDFQAQVAFWKTVGALDVAPGGMMSDCRDTLDDWLCGAARLDALGERLRQEGMRLSYHNHSFEFETFPGESRCKLDLLYENTHAQHLYAELDTAWVYHGCADPAAYMLKYSGRCPVIHVKDLHAEADAEGHVRFAELGQGVLDWPSIFKAGLGASVEWYVYEQDSCERDVFESAKMSLDFLKENVPAA